MTTATPSRSLSLVALFAALMAVFGLIPKIDLPFGVPITIQTLGVMLAGCLLAPRQAFQALLLFLGAVALGLPLLSGGRGGLGVFVAPSGGFLVGMLFSAVATSWIMRALPGRGLRLLALRAFAACVVGGIVVEYAFGIAGLVALARLSPWQAAAASLAFVPGDLIKCVLCTLVVHTVARSVPDWGFGDRITA